MTEDHWGLIALAFINLVSAFLTYRTHQLTQKVEIATNSMKDALVKSTGDARFSEGKEQGRLDEQRDNPK